MGVPRGRGAISCAVLAHRRQRYAVGKFKRAQCHGRKEKGCHEASPFFLALERNDADFRQFIEHRVFDDFEVLR